MTSQTQSKTRRLPWKMDFVTYGPFVALALLMVLGSIINPTFLSAGNLTNVLTRSAFIGIIAVGATFVISSGGIDLSVGSMGAFISGIMIIFMNHFLARFGASWTTIALAMGLSVAIGLAAGLINGIFITKGRIDSFIVTLGTMGIYRSLVTYLADGGTLSLNFQLRGVYRPVYYNSFLGVPIPLWAFFVVAIVGWLILNKTRFGRYCLAVGSNADVAKYSAVNVDRVRILTYILQGLCVAIATIIYVPRLGSASSSTGQGWELEAIAAVIIGGTALQGGSSKLWGTVAGAIMLSMIGNILNLTSAISQYLNGAVQGVIIIVAVLLQRSGRRR